MKNWSTPQVESLSILETQGGGMGGKEDGVMYNIKGTNFTIIGTSGPKLPSDIFVPKN